MLKKVTLPYRHYCSEAVKAIPCMKKALQRWSNDALCDEQNVPLYLDPTRVNVRKMIEVPKGEEVENRCAPHCIPPVDVAYPQVEVASVFRAYESSEAHLTLVDVKC